MLTVTIHECKGIDGRTWVSAHRTTDPTTARRRAITKHWGARAGFWSDSGLGPDYGQVIEPAGVSSSNCLTSRVRIDIE